MVGLGLLASGNQLGKGPRLSYRHIRQYLAVEPNAGLLHFVHKLAIGNTVGPGGRVYAGNPKTPQVAFSLPSVSVSVIQRVEHGFMSTAIKRMLRCPMPLGHGQYLLVPAVSRYTPRYS